jgi:hypothetical protein
MARLMLCGWGVARLSFSSSIALAFGGVAVALCDLLERRREKWTLK